MEYVLDTDRAHRSPPLGMLAIIFVLLFVASIVANVLITHGAPYPTPYRSLEQLQAHYAQFPDAARVTSFLQVGAAILLGLFTATAVSRLLFHRVQVAGVHIALFGGIASAVLLSVSALSSWALSQPGVATDTGAMRVIQLLAFATGGVGHTCALGLLLAGISVPSLVFRLMPRWVCWAGLVIAAVCELSSLSLVFPALSIFIPLGRFPAYLWLLAAGFALPKRTPASAPA